MRQAKKLGLPYTENPGLPVVLRGAIKHIFQDLSSPGLLEKCLHGQTENKNEALNYFI